MSVGWGSWLGRLVGAVGWGGRSGQLVGAVGRVGWGSQTVQLAIGNLFLYVYNYLCEVSMSISMSIIGALPS